MKFTPTPIPGAFVIEPDLRQDERGFFARAFCEREFAEHGLEPRLVQINNSYNNRRGTLRGMHYQLTPKAETGGAQPFGCGAGLKKKPYNEGSLAA